MWKTMKITDVCEQIYAGGDAPKKTQFSKIKTQEFTIPIFSNGANNNGLYGFANHSRTDKPAITVSARGTIGHIELRNEPFLPIVRLIVLVPNTSKIHIKFLKLALLNSEIFSSGSSIPQLTVPMLKELSIPVPSLAEQQRIVAKLDAAFAEIDTAIKAAEKNVENINALFDSSLELCLKGDDATVADIFLSDTNFVDIIDGDRGTNYPNKSEFLDDGFCLFLNTKNVLKDGFNFDNRMFITAEKDTLLRKGKLIREDVVLTTRGTIGNIGHYSQGVEFENIRINSGMVILRANSANISPKYLFEILRSRGFKMQVEKEQKGAAQQHIPIKTLYKIIVPVPYSLEHQNEIVQKISAHQVQVKALARLKLKKVSELSALKSAILAQELQSEAA